ncbi:MAG: cbb3-type cytochrome c oxidase subunit 3 [Betaproteobacteria bacterium]|nr:cbb3-type cytochrome c oxidase subunit 3 [Betaproteobacteria bacterium]
MDIDSLRAVYTVVAFLTFLGIVLWAYSGARRARFEEAARLPFDEEESPVGGQRQ